MTKDGEEVAIELAVSSYVFKGDLRVSTSPHAALCGVLLCYVVCCLVFGVFMYVLVHLIGMVSILHIKRGPVW